jgi:hypothetical protein
MNDDVFSPERHRFGPSRSFMDGEHRYLVQRRPEDQARRGA